MITGLVKLNGNPVTEYAIRISLINPEAIYSKYPWTADDGTFTACVDGGTWEIGAAQYENVNWVSPKPEELTFSRDDTPENKSVTVDLREAKRIMGVFAAAEGHSLSDIASVLNVNERTVCRWFCTFLLKDPEGLRSVKPPGRKIPAKAGIHCFIRRAADSCFRRNNRGLKEVAHRV